MTARLPARRSPSGPTVGPTSAALLDAAAAHYSAGRLEEAATLYRTLESRDPSDIRAPYSLAVIDLRRGLYEDARRRLTAVLDLQPRMSAAWHNLGVSAQSMGDWASAREAYSRTLDLAPNASQTRKNLAIALAVLGRTEEAASHYRILIAAPDPAIRTDAVTRLAILDPAGVLDAEISLLTQRAADVSLTQDARIGVTFALAGVLEARGKDDAAFDLYAAGNRLKHAALEAGDPAQRPASVAAHHARAVERTTALFTADFLATRENMGLAAVRPIFIVGLPRCGSSLVEQILASHPCVQGLGESRTLETVLAGGFANDPNPLQDAEHFRRLAGRYLDALARRGWERQTRPVDKSLDNALHVGVIHIMFPGAVILHVTRDLMDLGLACYRQLFASGNETLYDLVDIADEIRRHQALMAHWTEILPGRVLPVRYESLVDDPAHAIPALVVEACGLPWSAKCLGFHETARSVATASAAQVRRPIYRDALNRWRRHAGHLGPLAARLGLDAESITAV